MWLQGLDAKDVGFASPELKHMPIEVGMIVITVAQTSSRRLSAICVCNYPNADAELRETYKYKQDIYT